MNFLTYAFLTKVSYLAWPLTSLKGAYRVKSRSFVIRRYLGLFTSLLLSSCPAAKPDVTR
jgi:hypothetical protein